MSLLSDHLNKIKENFEFSSLTTNNEQPNVIPEISVDSKNLNITIDIELLKELLTFSGLAEDKVEKILNKISVLNKTEALGVKHFEYLTNNLESSINENLKIEMNKEEISIFKSK